MKLDLSVKTEHSEIATALGWSPDSILYSCSDDKMICRWGSDGSLLGKINTINYFISSISWAPAINKQASESFAISCTDGTFRFISKSGREEKKVSAHEGAVIVVRWSHDGSAILTAGEDGDVKIWSKQGNARATLASTGQSVYSACWGPDDDQVLIASGKALMIKTVQASRKNLQWNAHDGVILCTDWNVANGLIVSGGEDCVYRVWDSFGRQLYSNRPMENVITSVGWSPNGECFAVGSHNILRLCDKTGWTHCRERASTGSVLNIAWSSDGTQFAGAGGNGSVVFAQVVDRKFEWKHTEVTLVEPRKIKVQDTVNEALEELEFARDRVVEIGIGFDHLIVTTTTQCYVYSLQNLNTPIIFDVRAPSHFVHLSRSHFLTSDLISGVQVISYEGRILCSAKFQGLRCEYLTKDMVSLSPDTLVIVDTVDPRCLQVLDSNSGRFLNKITHSCEVSNVFLNQHTLGPQERILAFADRNRDLFVTALQLGGPATKGNATPITYKLLSHVESFAFNDETDALVGLADGRLLVWYYPFTAFVDRDLLPQTIFTMEAAEFGRNAQIISYTGNRVSVRKVDGSVLFFSTSPEIYLFYELVREARWEESVRMCRYQKNNELWASLAAAALAKKSLDTAEIALCEINEVAKAEYVQYIKSIPSEEGKSAELALFRRQPEEAERILLQASPPLFYRAIKMNLALYRWGRAMEIAIKFKSHVDTVLGYRKLFLDEFGKRENIPIFQQYSSQVTVEWETIRAKEEQEVVDEKRKTGGGGRGK